MVNLIPPRAKKGVILEYWVRVLTIWFVIFTVMIVLLGITLAPVHVLVEENINLYKDSAADANKKIASYSAVSDELDLATQQAQMLLSGNKLLPLSDLIYSFGDLEGSGIVLEGLTITREEGGIIAPVSLSGTARDRLALADFHKRLLAEEAVEDVDFPIENLAQDRNIEFTFTVTMSNTKTSS